MKEIMLFDLGQSKSLEKRENKAQAIRELFSIRKMNADQIEELTGYAKNYISKCIKSYPRWKVVQDAKLKVKRLAGLPLGTMVKIDGMVVQFVRYSKSHAYFNLDKGRGKQSCCKKEDFFGDVVEL